MTTPSPRVGEDELVARTGTQPARVRELADAGLLDRDRDGTYARRDIVRTRALDSLLAMGVSARDIGTAVENGYLSLGYLESAGRQHPRADRTFAELAQDLDLSIETLERLYVAYGLARPSPEERVREEDLQALRNVQVLIGAGVGEREVLRAARVWGDAARRVAQYLSHHFHTVVEEPFRRRGLGDNQAFEAAIRDVGLRMGRSGEELLAWLFRRHSETYLVRHQFDHAETALELAGLHERTGESPGAAAFADLTGYTRLTEEAGDDVAASVALRLADVVSEIASRHRGTVVKMLGDGVHFHFAEPSDAILAAIEVIEAVRPAGLPAAHVGIEAGPMIYEEGDYFGRTVNIAARIAAQAGADQVLVGEAIAKLEPPGGVRLVPAGGVELKGIAGTVALHRAVRDDRAS